VHFHPDTTRPDRWVRLIWELTPPAPDPARDLVILEHALAATCLHAEQVEGTWRITRRAPDGAVTIDHAAGVVRAPPRRDGWEPAPMLYALPPSLVGAGASIDVTLDPRPDAIARSARVILERAIVLRESAAG